MALFRLGPGILRGGEIVAGNGYHHPWRLEILIERDVGEEYDLDAIRAALEELRAVREDAATTSPLLTE